MPAGVRVVATGGTYGGSPFHGTLSALAERHPDGTDKPTFVTAATTLQVERLDAAPGTAPLDAEAQVTTIMPQLLPGAELVFPPTGEPVVLDVATGLLWWNGTFVGLNRDQILYAAHAIPSHARDVPQGPNGTWEFQLAQAAEIRKLVELLGAPKPLVWSRGAPGARFPNRLSPFLTEIGLERVGAHASVFVWARERFVKIRHCYEARNYEGVVACSRYYNDDYGYTGVAIQNEGRQTSVPLICGARGCDRDGFPYDRQLTLCPLSQVPTSPTACAAKGSWTTRVPGSTGPRRCRRTGSRPST